MDTGNDSACCRRAVVALMVTTICKAIDDDAGCVASLQSSPLSREVFLIEACDNGELRGGLRARVDVQAERSGLVLKVCYDIAYPRSAHLEETVSHPHVSF